MSSSDRVLKACKSNRPDQSLEITFVSTHVGHVRGGAEINDLTISSEFRKQGHNISFVTINGDNDIGDTDFQTTEVTCPYVYDQSYSLPEPIGKVVRHLNEELFIYRTWREASEQLRNADVVYATGRPILVRLQSLTDAPFVYAVRGRVNPLYDRYLKRADGLVFWGGCEQEYCDDSIFSIPHRKIDPGVDPEMFHPRQLEEPQKPEYADSERTVLLFSGRLDPVKRVENIVDAVGRIEDTFDLSLVILGDGSRRSDWEARAKSKLQETPVHFLGRVEHSEVPFHLNSSDIFVLASELENHPIALKEAIACGTYAVAPSIGRIPNIVEERSGYVYDENTVSGLVKALQTVLDQKLHEQYSRTERAEMVTDWSEATSELHNLFSQLR